MSSRSWDGVRLQRRGWTQTHTPPHTHSPALSHANTSPPCPSVSILHYSFGFFSARQAETQFHTHVSPSCELIRSETTTMGCGKNRISLYKHHHCLVWWKSKSALTLCRWNIGDKAEEMCSCLLLQSISTLGRKLVGGYNQTRGAAALRRKVVFFLYYSLILLHFIEGIIQCVNHRPTP